MPVTDDLLIGMAGAGGDGVISAGESLINAAALTGYHAILTKSFGPQIRGGESSFRLRVAAKDVFAVSGTLDVAIVLNWDDFMRFGAELPVGAGTTVIYEAECGSVPEAVSLAGVRLVDLVSAPITRLAKEAGSDRMKNTVVLGALAEWLGFAPEALLAGLSRKFAKKGPAVLETNERAFAAGRRHAANNPLPAAKRLASIDVPAVPKLLTDGNEMCGAAAIFAGCTFFGGYPITPSTEIMQYLGREIWRYGGVVFQAEDEISGVAAVVGASFAGKKAMTATSGPGMSLKTEVLGLASIAELPLVCVNVQRAGPSTGIPTKSEQADLFQAVFSAHGDVVRPVLAATNVSDMFATTVEAFNIAEEYQTPVVIVLSDADIGQRKEVVDPIDTSAFRLVERRKPTLPELEKYHRFVVTDSGISPLSEPGMPGGNYLASGIEHNETGAPTASGAVHEKMNEKRIRKFATLMTRRDLFEIHGPSDAPIGIVSWGSVSGVAREALGLARLGGVPVKLLVPRLLYPVAQQIYEEFFASVRTGFVVEQSHQGQLYRLLRMFVELPQGVTSLSRSGSNPFTPLDLMNHLRDRAIALERAAIPELETQSD